MNNCIVTDTLIQNDAQKDEKPDYFDEMYSDDESEMSLMEDTDKKNDFFEAVQETIIH